MEPTKLVALYLEAYFILSGNRVSTLEEIPPNIYLFFSDMQAEHLAHPVILHYRRKNWSYRRIANHLGIGQTRVRNVFKLHEI